MIHSHMAPYMCTTCGKCFNVTSTCASHIRDDHGGVGSTKEIHKEEMKALRKELIIRITPEFDVEGQKYQRVRQPQKK